MSSKWLFEIINSDSRDKHTHHQQEAAQGCKLEVALGCAEKGLGSQTWWHVSVIPADRRQRQNHGSKANLDDTSRSSYLSLLPQKSWGSSLVAECLLSIYKILRLISNTKKKKMEEEEEKEKDMLVEDEED